MEQTYSATATLGTGGTSVASNKAEKEALTRLLTLFNVFRKVKPTMPLQHAYTFLLVAFDEGQNVETYAERAGVAQTVMTRHLLDIGQQNRKREPGYGLVMQRQDPMDLRRHQTFLTRDGKALKHDLLRQIGE